MKFKGDRDRDGLEEKIGEKLNSAGSAETKGGAGRREHRESCSSNGSGDQRKSVLSPCDQEARKLLRIEECTEQNQERGTDEKNTGQVSPCFPPRQVRGTISSVNDVERR